MAPVKTGVRLSVQLQHLLDQRNGTRRRLGRKRRICRALRPRISAACHQVMDLAIARKITSCTFMVRSASARGMSFMPASGTDSYPKPSV